jgi:cellobiose phosphorylase
MAMAKLGDGKRAWELYNMINPIHHTDTAEGVETYKVEPYVMAADVYAAPQHGGRGGWTWYTGSASWMYRLMLESLLGLELIDCRLTIKPLFPEGWEEFKVHYRFRETVYHITVRKKEAGMKGERYVLDGIKAESGDIFLVDDHREHWVEVDVFVGEREDRDAKSGESREK